VTSTFEARIKGKVHKSTIHRYLSSTFQMLLDGCLHICIPGLENRSVEPELFIELRSFRTIRLCAYINRFWEYSSFPLAY
ncbi:MAG: hypothetical protein AAF789_15260, partial [Bacteroidota bacterium]